jgi:hypothetical protein
MTTSFTLSQDGKTFELAAERVAETDILETWRVGSRLDPDVFIALTNDRPLLHQKHLYRTSYKWTVVEGNATYRRMVKQITTYLEYHIKGLWHPPKKIPVETKNEPTSQGNLF